MLIAAICCISGWWYVDSQFLGFENEYKENTHLKTISINDYKFTDRNGNHKLDVYENEREPIEKRIADLLSKMTLDEKIHLLKGSGLASSAVVFEQDYGIPGAVGTIVSTPRLGIPTIYLADGPAGLRIKPVRKNTHRTFYCTAFPIPTLLASTWNTDMIDSVGYAMGSEAKAYGVDVLLAPGINIQRHPLCGRNFEYYSEDPLLTGKIGAAMVNGIEVNGVGCAVKHFVANNQETERLNNDVIVSERALREIYMKGFKLVVNEANPWSIMSSYNKVNGVYVSQNKQLLTEVLRNEWGYKGVVMSDWFGGNDPVAQIMAGNDLIEPGTKSQWDELKEAQRSGNITSEAIDTSVSRILKLIFDSPKMNHCKCNNNPDLKKDAAIALKSAEEGMVLLKNKEALPFEKERNIALVGMNSFYFIAGGSGSGAVNAAYNVSLEEGLMNEGYKINKYSKSIYDNYFHDQTNLFQQEEWYRFLFKPTVQKEIEYTKEQFKSLAEIADVAVVTIGRKTGEGADRKCEDFYLTGEEENMIQETCRTFHARGKNVVVVLNVGGVIETASWKDLPDAIVLAWQGGQEGGNALAHIFSGKVNPSGKLPVTFPVNIEDHASHKNFPHDGELSDVRDLFFKEKGKPEDQKIRNKDYTVYEEGINVGYRHFDKANLNVSFPFGYGLSYTEFTFENMDLGVDKDTVRINVTVQNTGSYAGKEVVQLYTLLPDSKVYRPVRELKAFAKTTCLNPGEMGTVNMVVPVTELRYWDEGLSKWVLEQGTYVFECGSSSRDIFLQTEADLY